MIIDGEDFKVDILLYNRYLKRLVAVELKQGPFQYSYSAQMKLYLKWLNRHERLDGENEPIGLILCAEGNKREQIELLEMDKDGIMVAEYWTTLPPKAEFERIFFFQTKKNPLKTKGCKRVGLLGVVATQQHLTDSKYFVVPSLA